MKYKLIRTDSSVNTEIDLICGIQSFGRNNFLDCDDKRVSRSHGQIEISHNGDIDLKALHLNPCFIRKNGSTEVIILNQGEVVRISRDDQFGLLPSLYWYKVMEYSDTGVGCANLPLEAVIKTELGISEPAASESNALKIPDIVIKKEIVDETDNFNSMCAAVSDSEKKEVGSNNIEIPKMKRSHSIEDEETVASPKLRRLSGGHSSASGEAENVTVKQEPISPKKEIKEESCSANAVPVNQPPVNDAPQRPIVLAPAVLQIHAMKRERCYYGSNCYRKNILHKQQFSHPTDPDWGTEEMAPCPYGRLCRKLDQRHFRDHSHPPNIILDDNLDQDQDSDEDEYHDGIDIGSDASVDIDYDF